MDVLYVTCETWMTCPSHMQNYIDGIGKLPEDWEWDGNVGNLPKLIFSVKIRLLLLL